MAEIKALQERLKDHPCFNQDARHKTARIHLPVAAHCNMQCNYCNRKHSCVNESRPGVTASVLRPGEAIEYLRQMARRLPELSVVGIAGPGDPMANATETLETLRMAKAEFPEMLLCLATNGLNLAPYIDDLIHVGISHVTVTVNAVDPEIGARFYKWMKTPHGKIAGIEAATYLWEMQRHSIRELASKNVIVKINTIYTPGINDAHVERVAQEVSVLGASVLNLMPLLPTKDTPFASFAEPDRKTLQNQRRVAARYLPQMAHCARCRADAAGKTGEANTAETTKLLQILSHSECNSREEAVPANPMETLPATLMPDLQIKTTDERPFIAVASKEGVFVNQHLGEALWLRIYRPGENRSRMVAARSLDAEAEGSMRWKSMADKLHDCAAVLVSGAGAMPRKMLAHYGITVAIVDGLIDEALGKCARGASFGAISHSDFRCNSDCAGAKNNCM